MLELLQGPVGGSEHPGAHLSLPGVQGEEANFVDCRFNKALMEEPVIAWKSLRLLGSSWNRLEVLGIAGEVLRTD